MKKEMKRNEKNEGKITKGNEKKKKERKKNEKEHMLIKEFSH